MNEEELLLKTLLEIGRTILLLSVHPDYAHDSEFADRIKSLEDLAEELKKPKPKTIFQKMHILNQMDEKNKTAHCSVFNELVSANMVKAGGHVTMGVDRGTFMEITLNPEKRAVLLIAIDREQFDSIK